MRPIGSTKERLAIYEREFINLLCLISCDKSLQPSTRHKLTRAFTLLYLTGCRVSEIVNLSFEDIQNIFTHKSLALNGATKTRKPRTIFFNKNMLNMLLKLTYYDTNEHNGFLFYENGKDIPMSKKGLTALLNTHLAKHLSPLYTTHSFRAGYVTRIVEATGNLKTAQDIIGHKSINTTIGYLSTSKQQKLDALDKIFGDDKCTLSH
ncbi:tyrosine-type recombinase/integrase [Campylobacter gastrosuis]|uniref:Site-specific integrase n=1 Tax=Campylobacter gastrosuis TaxID=2974576 RepID=A0ABT7HNK8_9BACT|nr:site-specific integrase [Campylobacter gastrosuis]MDL0088501.1 site-specific integrase [Campylobacter gastrosuis]